MPVVRLSAAPFQIDRRGVVFDVAPIAVHIGCKDGQPRRACGFAYRRIKWKNASVSATLRSEKNVLAALSRVQHRMMVCNRAAGFHGNGFRMPGGIAIVAASAGLRTQDV